MNDECMRLTKALLQIKTDFSIFKGGSFIKRALKGSSTCKLSWNPN